MLISLGRSLKTKEELYKYIHAPRWGYEHYTYNFQICQVLLDNLTN